MKSGLGKGLGKLMEGDKIAAGQPSPDQKETAKPLSGRGVTRLVQGSAPEQAQPGPVEKIDQPRPASLLPPWFFYGADLLLLLLSIAVAIASPKPLELRIVLFCGVSIALGGILSIIGLVKSGSQQK
jgi:hypothetical protein